MQLGVLDSRAQKSNSALQYPLSSLLHRSHILHLNQIPTGTQSSMKEHAWHGLSTPCLDRTTNENAVIHVRSKRAAKGHLAFQSSARKLPGSMNSQKSLRSGNAADALGHTAEQGPVQAQSTELEALWSLL